MDFSFGQSFTSVLNVSIEICQWSVRAKYCDRTILARNQPVYTLLERTETNVKLVKIVAGKAVKSWVLSASNLWRPV